MNDKKIIKNGEWNLLWRLKLGEFTGGQITPFSAERCTDISPYGWKIIIWLELNVWFQSITSEIQPIAIIESEILIIWVRVWRPNRAWMFELSYVQSLITHRSLKIRIYEIRKPRLMFEERVGRQSPVTVPSHSSLKLKHQWIVPCEKRFSSWVLARPRSIFCADRSSEVVVLVWAAKNEWTQHTPGSPCLPLSAK